MGASLPLSGIRVVDFTWVAAGPTAAMMLALQGADVIRVEAEGRTDMSLIVDNPSGDADEAPVYQCLNINKRNISIDLKRPEGQAVARRLAAGADIVMESMRPGRLKSLGIDYEELRREKPDLVMASLSGFGQVGPEAGYGGYAMVFGASGGHSHVTGYVDGIPTPIRGTADMRTGISLLVPMLAALRHAKRTGEGSFIDLAGVETAACVLGDAILDVQLNGRDAGLRGNDDRTMAPHGVYECSRDQSFVTIACRDDRDWAGLCRVFPTLGGLGVEHGRDRWLRRAEIDTVLRPLVRARDRDELACELQREGVPGVPSLSNKDLYEDPHPHERGTWLSVDHPVQGERWVVGLPWSSSITGRGAQARPAPLLNQYSREILGELGISGAEADALVEEGVIGDRRPSLSDAR